MLALTIRLDEYREDLFKIYLENPLEEFSQYQNYSQKQNNRLHKFSKWSSILDRVMEISSECNMKTDVIPTYLEHLCFKYNGSLDSYSQHISKHYIQSFEKRVKVYLTDKGLVDMGN